MTLKGQYVSDENDQIGMIESEEADEEGFVMVYYGKADDQDFRVPRSLRSLAAIKAPLNSRIDGEIPEPE